MLIKTFGSAVYGIDATTITVEVNCNQGTKFYLVGLPDNAVKESQQRLMAAFKNTGFRMPGKKIVVNMSPADIRIRQTLHAGLTSKLMETLRLFKAAQLAYEEKTEGKIRRQMRFVLEASNATLGDTKDLEALLEPFLEQTAVCCRRALGDSELEAEDLDAVVLVGGSTRIPAVRALAAEIFGREPNLSQHPDEAVALGGTKRVSRPSRGSPCIAESRGRNASQNGLL